jgi:hypothetical protein
LHGSSYLVSFSAFHKQILVLPRYAISGKAKSACQDFFAPDAYPDPDIPILKQAKAEYAKLK